MPTEAELRALMERSDADVAAGRIVPAEQVLAYVRAAADRVRAAKVKRSA